MQADRGQPHKERKADHIRINLEEDVTFPNLTTGLESYRLRHQALPELDLGAVELQHSLLGKRLSAPLLISSMTGGTARTGDQSTPGGGGTGPRPGPGCRFAAHGAGGA